MTQEVNITYKTQETSEWLYVTHFTVDNKEYKLVNAVGNDMNELWFYDSKGEEIDGYELFEDEDYDNFIELHYEKQVDEDIS